MGIAKILITIKIIYYGWNGNKIGNKIKDTIIDTTIKGIPAFT